MFNLDVSVVYFFETKQEALDELKRCKVIFIADFDISEDPRVRLVTEDSPDELVEELFEMVSDIDTFYNCSYMDKAPFYSNIVEVRGGSRFEL